MGFECPKIVRAANILRVRNLRNEFMKISAYQQCGHDEVPFANDRRSRALGVHLRLRLMEKKQCLQPHKYFGSLFSYTRERDKIFGKCEGFFKGVKNSKPCLRGYILDYQG